MKLDVFDVIVGSFIAVFAILIVLDIAAWIARQLRALPIWRRLRGLEPEEYDLPTPNAGFSLGGSSSATGAARRHFARDDELRLLTHLGWGQTRPNAPPIRDE
ncbi:MAG: hypothetical protein AAF657_24285 [Acidobacteriota bacterium]